MCVIQAAYVFETETPGASLLLTRTSLLVLPRTVVLLNSYLLTSTRLGVPATFQWLELAVHYLPWVPLADSDSFDFATLFFEYLSWATRQISETTRLLYFNASLRFPGKLLAKHLVPHPLHWVASAGRNFQLA